MTMTHHYQAGREPTHENVRRSLLFVSARPCPRVSHRLVG
jgi:hypothetical protein